jgi:hypothetical protein
MLSNYKFSKPQGDSFANPKLNEFLTGQRVNELYLAGLDPEFCIYATARGALNRGYKVNVITDAILSWRDTICIWTKNNNEGIFEKYRKEGIKIISGKECIIAARDYSINFGECNMDILTGEKVFIIMDAIRTRKFMVITSFDIKLLYFFKRTFSHVVPPYHAVADPHYG